MDNARCQCGKQLKNSRHRLCGECSKYWEFWDAICRLKNWRRGDDAQRRAWHVMAGLSADKSHYKFAHGEFTRLFNWTRSELAGDANLNAAMEAANPEIGERREMVRGTEDRLIRMRFSGQMPDADWRDSAVAEAEEYLQPILERGYQYQAFIESRGWKAWRELPMNLLKALHTTIIHRERSAPAAVADAREASDAAPFDDADPMPPDDDGEAWWEQEMMKEAEATERAQEEVFASPPDDPC